MDAVTLKKLQKIIGKKKIMQIVSRGKIQQVLLNESCRGNCERLGKCFEKVQIYAVFFPRHC